MEKVSAFATLEEIWRIYGQDHAFMSSMVQNVRIAMKSDILLNLEQSRLLRENVETKSSLPPCLQAMMIAAWLNSLADTSHNETA